MERCTVTMVPGNYTADKHRNSVRIVVGQLEDFRL